MNIKEKIRLIGSYVTFLFMGVLGIYIGIYSIVHLKDPNYMILLGGTGIIILTLIFIKDEYKQKNRKSSNIE